MMSIITNAIRMSHPHKLWLLFIACILLTAPTDAQSESRREYLFSGPLRGADCSVLPAPAFEIGPSLDRADTKDRLAVLCAPGKEDSPAILSLKFTIIGEQDRSDGELKQYSFRWGKSVNSQPTQMFHGQFTKDSRLCTTIADFLQAHVPATVHSGSENLPASPQWSASCNPDDMWGTSMEIVLTGKVGESL
jgi:hypothetical protein